MPPPPRIPLESLNSESLDKDSRNAVSSQVIFTNDKNSNVKEQHSINEYTESQTKESSQSLQDKRENNHEKEEYITQQTEGYCFHILTDFIQQNTYNKLQDLAKELSSIYPCSIQVHIVDNTL